MFSRTNIANELFKEKKKGLLDEARLILEREYQNEKNIFERIRHPKQSSNIVFLENEPVFNIEQIKTIAIRYRLRFLDSDLFKGEIPYEAILRIKEIEKNNGIRFSAFKILAPASLFKLENRNKDPLLFACLGNGNYLLIHKWGNDLSWFRRILVYPIQCIQKFILSILLLSLLISVFIPADYPLRLFTFFFCNLFLLSFFVYVGYVRLNQNLSEFEWNSRFIS